MLQCNFQKFRKMLFNATINAGKSDIKVSSNESKHEAESAYINLLIDVKLVHFL